MIRPAEIDEQHMVAECVNAAYSKYIERMGRAPAPMLADYTALIRNGIVYVMAAGEGIHAVLVLIPEPDHLFLENIAVHPDYQGKGLGRQLMAWVEQRAADRNLAEIRLYTNEAMHENLDFYRRLGYEEVDRRLEDGFRRVFMRKLLPRTPK
ncbi:MAG: GNAT family N-acetyltransferase [Dehalococcoidia bacterium]